MKYQNEIVSDNGKKFTFESNYKINDDVKQVLQDIAFKKSIIDNDWENIQTFIDNNEGLKIYSDKYDFQDFGCTIIPEDLSNKKEAILVIYASPDITLSYIKDICDTIREQNKDIQIWQYIYTEEQPNSTYFDIVIIYSTPENKTWSKELQAKTYEEIANMITTSEPDNDELLWVLGASWAPYARLKHINGKLGKMSVENASKNYHAPPNERKYIIEVEDEKGATTATEEFDSVDDLITDGWVLD